MNIFYTDLNPKIAARNLCNRHIVKMGIESVQLLSNALPEQMRVYKTSHWNHPCSIWVRNSFSNFQWLCQHAQEIFSEYTKRYGKIHKSELALKRIIASEYTGLLPDTPFSEPPKCMPPEFHNSSTIESYRRYYINKKASFSKWMKSEDVPYWWPFPHSNYTKCKQ